MKYRLVLPCVLLCLNAFGDSIPEVRALQPVYFDLYFELGGSDPLNPMGQGIRYGSTTSAQAVRAQSCGGWRGNIEQSFGRCALDAAMYKADGIQACSNRTNSSIGGGVQGTVKFVSGNANYTVNYMGHTQCIEEIKANAEVKSRICDLKKVDLEAMFRPLCPGMYGF